VLQHAFLACVYCKLHWFDARKINERMLKWYVATLLKVFLEAFEKLCTR